MIRRFGGAAALTTVILSVGGTALAAPPLPKPEKTLLGVRLMATFNDVLKKYGQPSEIQIGGPTLPNQVPDQTNQGNTMGGYPGMQGRPGGMPGFPGMPGGMMRPGAGGARGGLPGFPGMQGMPGGMPGYPGAPGGMARRMMGGAQGGMPGAYPGMPGGMTRPGMGGGMPGYPGAPGGMSGMPSEGGLPGFPGAGGAGMPGGYPGANINPMQPNGAEEQSQETTWWYHYPQKGLHYGFLFNSDGRVIQIQEYGWKGGGRTLEGVGLGSSLGQVIQHYGWSSDGDRTGDNLLLNYGGRDRLALQLIRNHVAGITLGLVK